MEDSEIIDLFDPESSSNLRRTKMTTIRNALYRFYDALACGDLNTVRALFSADIEWTEAERFPYCGGTWRGSEAIVENLFKPLSRDWTTFSAQPEHYIVEDDQAVVLGVYIGSHRRTGRSLTAPFAHHWTFRLGKIVRFVQYTDTAKILEAIGEQNRINVERALISLSVL
jgi:ketosteroid isomerase-like protein